MKILFLDIDGVLNSGRSCAAFGGFPHDFSLEGMAQFDMVAVGLIRKLCQEAEVEIVLSSTWRIDYSAEEVSEGLDLPVIDVTPRLNGIRGMEINAWLSEHQEVTSYAIIDDNSDMLEDQKSRFVQTDFEEGLSLKNYSELKVLFGIEKSFPENA